MALHFILHLDYSGTYARILFVDFSSAFNTIIPALLQNKLSQLNVPDSTSRWITDFLFDRRQHVKLWKHVSDSQTISTGSPQGCVLSPLLFPLYTNSCTTNCFSHSPLNESMRYINAYLSDCILLIANTNTVNFCTSMENTFAHSCQSVQFFHLNNSHCTYCLYLYFIIFFDIIVYFIFNLCF